MGKSRISKRREIEAAEAKGEKTTKEKVAKKKESKKRKTAARPRRAKDTPARRRIVWVVYSSTMREEGRFLYHERDKADEKLEQLLAKGKRRYFIQPFKEPLDSEGAPLVADPAEEAAKKEAAKVARAEKAKKAKEKADAEAEDEDGDDDDD